MPQDEQLQSALWANDSFLDDITDSRGGIALLEAPTKTATTFKIPIEDVPLGARVPTKNPRPWEYDDSLPEPDEVSWSKVAITVERKDGQIVDAELLRPTSWIETNGLYEGTRLPMQIDELQIDGIAHVTSVESCPPISSGEGSVVTARFITRQVDEVATIEVIGPDGQIESLTGTKIHPIWSVDRQDWVPLAELREGETLQASAGIATVISVTLASCTQPVYNIEVHGEHVYQVGEFQLLVHNTYGDVSGLARKSLGELSGELNKARNKIGELKDQLDEYQRAYDSTEILETKQFYDELMQNVQRNVDEAESYKGKIMEEIEKRI